MWKPFDASGRPDDQWPRLHETLEQLRAVSGEALLAVVGLAISERLDVTFGRDLARNVRTAAQGPAGDRPRLRRAAPAARLELAGRRARRP